jgi:flagellar motor switch protein FliN/FliY
VLRTFSADGIEHGQPVVQLPEQPLLGSLPMPAIAASVTYVDGVSGGSIFALTRLGARRLAAAMMMQDPADATADEELSELELSAIGEVMSQMMAAAATATGTLLGEDVAISSPETRFLHGPDDVVGAWELTPHVVATPFSILGEPSRLVQLVPNAFIVRMNRAHGILDADAIVVDAHGSGETLQPDELRAVPVRLWAELGRVRMPIARAAALGQGEVVELDRMVEEPVSLFVNGHPFATGRLVLVEDGDWAVRVESLVEPTGPLPGGAS